MNGDDGSINSRQERDRQDHDHDQWYSGLFLGLGVMLLAFAMLLIATMQNCPNFLKALSL